MKLGLIDSGIGDCGAIKAEQYVICSSGIEKEALTDNSGHGSSMFSIISEKLSNDDEVLSIRLDYEREETNRLVALAIDFCVKKDVDVINVSLGSSVMKDVELILQSCKNAFSKNILIVAAASNYDEIILPWGCDGVIKVRQGNDITGRLEVGYDSFRVCNIFVNTRRYGKKRKISLGNSAAAAYVSSLLCESIKKMEKPYIPQKIVKRILPDADVDIEKVFEGISLITSEIAFIDNYDYNWGRAVVVPFSKEMDSIIRYGQNIKVVAGSGGVQTSLSKERNIPAVSLEDDFSEYCFDTIVIGYLDKLQKINSSYSENYLVDFAIKNHLNIFSFVRLEAGNEKKLKSNKIYYRHSGDITKKELSLVRKAVPFNLLPHKPVLGVFGTSSKQGKFTCQLSLKKVFEERNIKVDFIGTEHQSALVGCVMDYPSGYSGRENIKLSIEDSIEFLQKCIFYIDQKCDGELIMVGGQSWLIPYDIDRQTAIYNLAFLEATRPDYAVLVINPEYDCESYVVDTIRTLESVYRCRVIALAFSDKRPVSEQNISLKVKRTEDNILEVSQKLEAIYDIKSGCIMDGSFMEDVIDVLM